MECKHGVPFLKGNKRNQSFSTWHFKLSGINWRFLIVMWTVITVCIFFLRAGYWNQEWRKKSYNMIFQKRGICYSLCSTKRARTNTMGKQERIGRDIQFYSENQKSAEKFVLLPMCGGGFPIQKYAFFLWFQQIQAYLLWAVKILIKQKTIHSKLRYSSWTEQRSCWYLSKQSRKIDKV